MSAAKTLTGNNFVQTWLAIAAAPSVVEAISAAFAVELAGMRAAPGRCLSSQFLHCASAFFESV